MSRRRHTTIPPSTPFLRCRRFHSKIRTVGLSETLGFKRAGVAPLPPCSRKILDETAKTSAVFLSWFHLLGGEDDCMLSVPLSTSDLHYSSWLSGEICQVLFIGACTLLCHAFWFSLKEHDRTGHPLFAVTQVTRKVPLKHVPLMKARTSTLETKQIMIER